MAYTYTFEEVVDFATDAIWTDCPPGRFVSKRDLHQLLGEYAAWWFQSPEPYPPEAVDEFIEQARPGITRTVAEVDGQ